MSRGWQMPIGRRWPFGEPARCTPRRAVLAGGAAAVSGAVAWPLLCKAGLYRAGWGDHVVSRASGPFVGEHDTPHRPYYHSLARNASWMADNSAPPARPMSAPAMKVLLLSFA